MTRMVDKGELDGNKSLIGRERGGRREREEGGLSEVMVGVDWHGRSKRIGG